MSCDESTGSYGCEPTRRDALRILGAAVSAAIVPIALTTVMAGPFERADFEKLVPVDKKLTPQWLKSLFERGAPAVYRGQDLKYIGMPVGGIGAGQIYLVSDGFVPAPTIDPNLKNPWGIAFAPGGPFWVADNNSGFSTLYNGAGAKLKLEVTIPPPAGSPAGTTATPTGTVFNATTDFQVGSNNAAFIFATEDGTISGWNSGTNAVLKVDNSGSNAVYKGLAIGSNAGGNFLYAANFRSGKVDVFDKNFAAATLAGTFTDPNLAAPAAGKPGFAPFGIQNIGGKLYVSYALQNAEQHDDVAGLGNGFVDVFDTNGNFLQRLISGGQLDSPWGLTVAPATFGAFGNDLLVGNFGNSRINAFDPTTGSFQGTLQDAQGNDLSLSDVTDGKGLWGIKFGGGGNGGDPNTLFFASGINDEQDGLFGSVQATTAVPLPNAAFTGLTGIAATIGGGWLRRRVKARA